MTKRNKIDRSGMGILIVLVAVLMLGVFITGFAQLTLADRVQRDGASLVDGERSRFAVQSALDEAAHEFSKQANEPANPLYLQLRSGRAFDGAVAVPVSAKLFADQGPLDGGSVKFEYRPVVTDDGPYMGGLVRFQVAAGSGWLRRDARRGTATREVRVAPVMPPHPFDDVTLLILSPFPGLLDPGRANTDLEENLRKSRELTAARASLTALVEQVRAHLAKAGPIGEKFNGAVSSVAERPLPQHPEYTHNVEDRFHFIDASAVVASFEAKIDDLQKLTVSSSEVEQMASEIERTSQPVAQCEKQLREALEKILKVDTSKIEEAYEGDQTTHAEADKVIEAVKKKLDEYRKFALEHANALLARSLRYTQFTDQLVEYTSNKAREVHTMATRLFDVENAWPGRASFRFNSSDELKRFVDGYTRRGEGIRGIAYQAASSSPVDLGGLQFEGRLVVATPATVSGSGGAASSTRSLTVVTSKFELGGQCQASVVCRQFQGTAGSALSGRLLIQELRSQADLAGSLTSRGYGSDPAAEQTVGQLQAVVSPWCVEAEITRGS